MHPDFIFLVVWAIVGIIFATLMKIDEQKYLTIKDVICLVIIGSVCGGIAGVTWFLISDVGDKVVWRKKGYWH